VKGRRSDHAGPRRGPGHGEPRQGTIINVSGMLAFSGPASSRNYRFVGRSTPPHFAHIVALSQVLHEELKSHGLHVQALCPVSWRPSFTNAKD